MADQRGNFYLSWHGFPIVLLAYICVLGDPRVVVNARGADYYRAAVFEHVRYEDFSESTDQGIITRNLDSYATAAKTAAAQEADIIIFPEWGLYKHDKLNRSDLPIFAEDVPDPSDDSNNPCDNEDLFKDRPVLLRLSCIAKNNRMFLVANMVDTKTCIPESACDKESCSSDNKLCPPDGRKFYNTNVVFNREGTLVSKYHKTHLYFEPNFNVPAYPKAAYFETDFGLFTTFICFDMSYWEAVNAVEERNVINVAYPTFWFDHLPLLSAIQFQQAWAMTNKVNLLAANVHHLGTGTIGSGIYSGVNGALVYTFQPDGAAKLLISRVPLGKDLPQDFDPDTKIFSIEDGDVKDITDSDQDSDVPEQCSMKILGLPKDPAKDYRCLDMDAPGTTYKKLEEATGSLDVCNNDLCCGLTYSTDSIKDNLYLGVYNDIAWVYNTYGFCLQICMLMRCDYKGEKGGCSTYPMSSETRFHRFKLTGNFTTKYVYPSVMKSKMRLAPIKEWKFHNIDKKSSITYHPESDNGEKILSAGLYGRCYDEDPPPRF